MRGRDVVEQDGESGDMHWRRMMKMESGTLDQDYDRREAVGQEDEDGKGGIGAGR